MNQQQALNWIEGNWKNDPKVKTIGGKLGIDVDGYYGFQCADFVQAYARWLGHPLKPGNARTYWEQPQDAWYTKISSPQPGDISVFAPNAANGQAGHTDVVLSIGNGIFESVAQNWGPGSNGVTGLPPATVSHTTLGIYGFLRPQFKGDNMPPIGDIKTVASLAQTLGVPLTADQIAYYAQKTYGEFYTDVIGVVNEARLAALAANPNAGTVLSPGNYTVK